MVLGKPQHIINNMLVRRLPDDNDQIYLLFSTWSGHRLVEMQQFLRQVTMPPVSHQHQHMEGDGSKTLNLHQVLYATATSTIITTITTTTTTIIGLKNG